MSKHRTDFTVDRSIPAAEAAPGLDTRQLEPATPTDAALAPEQRLSPLPTEDGVANAEPDDLVDYAEKLTQLDLQPGDEIIESRKGLWIWRGNDLIGRVPYTPPRELTPAMMREELADLQRRIDAIARPPRTVMAW